MDKVYILYILNFFIIFINNLARYVTYCIKLFFDVYFIDKITQIGLDLFHQFHFINL